jgi:hypothetical protein
MAIWRGMSVRLLRGEEAGSGHRDAGQARTTMLSVAAHIGQAKVRNSKPGLSCSRSERIIGASQSAQNGRPLEALPWKKRSGTIEHNASLVGRERNVLGHR